MKIFRFRLDNTLKAEYNNSGGEVMEYPKITLKAARINADLSQKEPAEALKVNVSTLQNYETGKTVPDWEMVKRIEQVYSFPADFIIFAKCSA